MRTTISCKHCDFLSFFSLHPILFDHENFDHQNGLLFSTDTSQWLRKSISSVPFKVNSHHPNYSTSMRFCVIRTTNIQYQIKNSKLFHQSTISPTEMREVSKWNSKKSLTHLEYCAIELACLCVPYNNRNRSKHIPKTIDHK